MKGTPPPALKTTSDYERLHQLALDGELRRSDIERLRQRWSSLLDPYIYQRDRQLDDDEDPDGDKPEYRVIEDELEDGTVERWQLKRARDPNARIDRLGYSEDEVQSKLDELDEVLND